MIDNEYKLLYNTIYRETVKKQADPYYDAAGLPAYVHENPFMAWLFWERIRIALDVAGDLKNKKVLDFGCGNGVLFKYLHENNCSIFGCEDAYFELSKDVCNRIDVPVRMCRDLREIDGEKFDAIFALDALEHVEALESIVEKFLSFSKKESQIILSGPTENILYKMGRTLAGFSGNYHERNIYQVERSMRIQGFEMVKMKNLCWLFRISRWRTRGKQ
jgi:2-polyprenyl-3-methyl-5-hydroxy-6-metoxy-1,4-benzoquinol methylase